MSRQIYLQRLQVSKIAGNITCKITCKKMIRASYLEYVT